VTETTNKFPYTAPENVMRVVKRIRQVGPPPIVTPEYVKQLGIVEELAKRIVQTLEFLGLVTEDGVPTEVARALHAAPEADWQRVFQGTLLKAYAPIFRVVDPQKASRLQVRDAFRTSVPMGSQERMVTLFLGLCAEAGFQVAEPPTNRPARNGKAARTLRVSSRTFVPIQPAAEPVASQNRSERDEAERRRHTAIEGWIQEIPPLGSPWSRDDFDSWLATLRTMLERLYHIDKTGAKEREEAQAGT
jgi:hypothetical protein